MSISQEYLHTHFVNTSIDASRKDRVLGGGMAVSRHSIMSENLKNEIAKELGVYQTVKSEGWGSVSSRNCGNIVRKAIEMAERKMS